ncbi:MAG: helix-turn-helix domain-containing protein [Candidatus Neomarinimicrobiota bacterium]
MNGFTWQFGERFRQIRRMTKLTQDEFGQLLGVSRQTINAYENDRQRPTLDMMEKVCRLQGISPRWILTGMGDPKADPSYLTAEEALHSWTVGEKTLAPEQISLIKFITEDRARAVKLAHFLLDEALKRLPSGHGSEVPGPGSEAAPPI